MITPSVPIKIMPLLALLNTASGTTSGRSGLFGWPSAVRPSFHVTFHAGNLSDLPK
jgi:hypothetical protein